MKIRIRSLVTAAAIQPVFVNERRFIVLTRVSKSAIPMFDKVAA
ncbi:MAG: hypothetical protein QM831_03515 [Kofleriaceae bacterium]